MITDKAVNCKNLNNSEKFKLRISNIQVVHDLIQDLWVIYAKFQYPMITVTAVISKNSKNSKISEKFELRISNIRIVEDTMATLVITHAKY